MIKKTCLSLMLVFFAQNSLSMPKFRPPTPRPPLQEVTGLLVDTDSSASPAASTFTGIITGTMIHEQTSRSNTSSPFDPYSAIPRVTPLPPHSAINDTESVQNQPACSSYQRACCIACGFLGSMLVSGLIIQQALHR